jgi:PEGA domain
MRITSSLLLAGAVVAAGCGTTGKNFKITSYPAGATVFVDGELRGQTGDDASVYIKFHPDPLVTIRLQKEGYQPTGAVLSVESPDEIAFFLQEAPHHEKVLETLKDIRNVLDQISTQLPARGAR